MQLSTASGIVTQASSSINGYDACAAELRAKPDLRIRRNTWRLRPWVFGTPGNDDASGFDREVPAE